MTEAPQQPDEQIATQAGPRILPAFRKAARQFFSIIPVLIYVILLVGLFRGFVSRNLLLTIFSGNVIQDTLWGACIGSVLSGNPLNSYVVGETLLKMGVSMFGAVALMLTWVRRHHVSLLSLIDNHRSFLKRFAKSFYKFLCSRRWLLFQNDSMVFSSKMSLR